MRRKVVVVVGALLVLVGSMIDRVQLEGDHVAYLVIAPHPTWRFRYGGGEEGAWQKKHPGQEQPWWLAGRYLRLMEVTDS